MTTKINHQKIASDFKMYREKQGMSIYRTTKLINQFKNVSIAQSTIFNFEKGNGVAEFQLLIFCDFANLDIREYITRN